MRETESRFTSVPIAKSEQRLALVFLRSQMSHSVTPRRRFVGRPCPTHAEPSHDTAPRVSASTQLRVMRLRFGLQAKTRVDLAIPKSWLVYDALLWQLKAMWCHRDGECRSACRLPHLCLFGHLIKPQADPAWAPAIRRWMGSSESPAYIVWDECDNQTRIAVNEVFNFELVLIGQAAMQQIPAFVAAAMMAAEQGFGSGKQRLRASLTRIDVLNSVSERARVLMVNGKWQETLVEDLSLAYGDGQEWATRLVASQNQPLTRLQLSFRSPTKLEAQGHLVRKPYFQSVWSAIVRRIRILSQAYGSGDLPLAEYKPLLALASQVQLERDETIWIQSPQHNAHGRSELDEGFMGHAWYSAPVDLKPLLPILWFGQWVHIGAEASYGNGRYQLEAIT
jgi:hypothetical protein